MHAAIVIIVLIVIAALALYIQAQPDEFRTTRTLAINASPAAIYSHISDLRKNNEWSPWTELDPAITQTYEGPSNKIGGVYKWSGNKKIGEGILTLTDLRPDEFVRMKLEFLKPFKAINTAEYLLTPQTDGKTMMSWTMYGQNTFLSKAMSLVMNCDKMVGDRFDKGLNTLKTTLETPHGN